MTVPEKRLEGESPEGIVEVVVVGVALCIESLSYSNVFMMQHRIVERVCNSIAYDTAEQVRMVRHPK